jgi:dCTP deaminase
LGQLFGSHEIPLDSQQAKIEYTGLVITDVEIREAIQDGHLRIEPLESKNIEPASYDLRAGRVLLARRGVIDLRNEPVVLRHGDWAEIESVELFELPLNLAATVGVRSSLTRRGLVWFGGPQFDPGYQGKAYISAFNASSAPIEITHGMSFATAIFYRLAKNASRPYAGRYQRQVTFPEDDVERMMKMEAYTLSDVIQSVGLLGETVQKLTQTSEKLSRDFEVAKNDLGWIKTLLIAILIALVVGVGQQLFKSLFH